MRFILLSFLLVSFIMNAQPETGKKSKLFSGFPILVNPKNEVKPIEIRPEKTNPFAKKDSLKNNEPLFTPSSSIFQEKKKPSFVIGENRNEIMKPKTDFINPNADLLNRLNGKLPKPVSEDFITLKGDKEFCNIKTKSDYLYVVFRDFGEVDGDQFRILMNGEDLTGFVTLTGYYQEIKIKIENGFNKIDFEILNVGSVSPNTAEFQFSTSPGVIICKDNWALLNGFKAVVQVFKEIN